MEDKKIRIAITHGDTNGIGYETIFKTFAEPSILELFTPIIYGSPKVAAYHRKSLNMQVNFNIISKAEDAHPDRLNILTCFNEEVKVDLGIPTEQSAKAGQLALDRALADYKQGLFDALVLLPINATENNKGTKNTVQFDAIEEATDSEGKGLTIYVDGDLRIASLTDDIPLRDALSILEKDHIIERAKTFSESLRRDFRISNPRIALLQANPQPGPEEKDTLQPAINELLNAGVGIYGPYPADEYFSTCQFAHFDGTLAIYYNQAMTPLRMLASDSRVVLIAGLPIVHTAPYFSPRFDIAGKGEADESALRQAIYLAIDAFRNRANYDEPLANPLKKLYHEKRDDSEKVRFSIPKKHESHA